MTFLGYQIWKDYVNRGADLWAKQYGAAEISMCFYSGYNGMWDVEGAGLYDAPDRLGAFCDDPALLAFDQNLDISPDVAKHLDFDAMTRVGLVPVGFVADRDDMQQASERFPTNGLTAVDYGDWPPEQKENFVFMGFDIQSPTLRSWQEEWLGESYWARDTCPKLNRWHLFIDYEVVKAAAHKLEEICRDNVTYPEPLLPVGVYVHKKALDSLAEKGSFSL